MRDGGETEERRRIDRLEAEERQRGETQVTAWSQRRDKGETEERQMRDIETRESQKRVRGETKEGQMRDGEKTEWRQG